MEKALFRGRCQNNLLSKLDLIKRNWTKRVARQSCFRFCNSVFVVVSEFGWVTSLVATTFIHIISSLQGRCSMKPICQPCHARLCPLFWSLVGCFALQLQLDWFMGILVTSGITHPNPPTTTKRHISVIKANSDIQLLQFDSLDEIYSLRATCFGGWCSLLPGPLIKVGTEVANSLSYTLVYAPGCWLAGYGTLGILICLVSSWWGLAVSDCWLKAQTPGFAELLSFESVTSQSEQLVRTGLETSWATQLTIPKRLLGICGFIRKVTWQAWWVPFDLEEARPSAFIL